MKLYDDMGREFDSEYDINHDGHIDREEEYAAGVTFASDYEDEDDILRTCRDYDIDPDDVPGYRERHSQSSNGYYDGYDSDYDDDYSDGYSDGYDAGYHDGSVEYDIYGNPRRFSSGGYYSTYGSPNRTKNRYKSSSPYKSTSEHKANSATREELASMIERYTVSTSKQVNSEWQKAGTLIRIYQKRFPNDYLGYLYEIKHKANDFQHIKDRYIDKEEYGKLIQELDLIYNRMLPFIPYDRFDEVQTEVARLRSIYLSAHEVTNQIRNEWHDSENKKTNGLFMAFLVAIYILVAIASFLSIFV